MMNQFLNWQETANVNEIYLENEYVSMDARHRPNSPNHLQVNC